jgi:DNA-binding GntR family transcriptional regulator
MLERSPGPAVSLTEAAVETIRDRILDLTLEPGSRIDERVLMTRFALSRTPAREALNRLVAEGLVKIQPKKGASVRPLDLAHVRQLFDAYFVSERMNGYFCRTHDDGLVDDLVAFQDAYDTAQKAWRFLDMTRINTRMHSRIAAATHNEYIIDFCARLQNQARRLSYFVYLHEKGEAKNLDRHQKRIRRDHLDIIAAVRAGDNGKLVDVLTEHARLFQERIMHAIGDTRGTGFPLPGESTSRDATTAKRR